MQSFLALFVGILAFAFLYKMQQKGYSFMVRILTATAAGIVIGLLFKGATDYFVVFGRIYSNLLKALVIPLLFFSIVSTLSSLSDVKTLSSIGGKTLGLLGLHNILGSLAGIGFSFLFKLGVNSNIAMDTAGEINEVPPFTDVLVSFFPSNIVDHAANNTIIPIVIFCILLGIGIILYKNKEEIKPFTDFIEAGSRLMSSLIGLVIKFTPYAVMSLISNQVSMLDLSFVSSLLVLLLVIFLADFFHTFITSSAMIALIAKVNPIIFQKKFFPAWLVGFTTQSSLGSLPVNIKAQEDMGVEEEVASFVTPISTTFGMPGCAAIWPTALAVFTINALGLHFGFSQYLMMIMICVLISLGTVGVPGTGTIQATALFAAMGLPVEMILVLSPIAGIADMARTSTNVHAGGSSGLMVAKLENMLDTKKYYA